MLRIAVEDTVKEETHYYEFSGLELDWLAVGLATEQGMTWPDDDCELPAESEPEMHCFHNFIEGLYDVVERMQKHPGHVRDRRGTQ